MFVQDPQSPMVFYPTAMRRVVIISGKERFNWRDQYFEQGKYLPNLVHDDLGLDTNGKVFRYFPAVTQTGR